MVYVGFIGLGNMGLNQVRSFAKVRGCKIVAGADPSSDARGRFEKEFGATTYASHKELLGDANVDAVVIVAPTKLHKDIANDCMKAGRDVLTEKPMARTVRDCQSMMDVADKTGKLLMVAHCRRFDKDWGTFADIYNKGMIGKKVLWRHCMAGFGPQNPWFMDDKLGGGPLVDGAVHDQDFANMLFGDPQYVQASSMKMTENSAVDTATAIVHYENGSQLMLSWSWGTATGGRMQDAVGPKGTCIFHPKLDTPDFDPGQYAYYLVTDRKTRKEKVVKKKRGSSNMYVEQAKHFIACVSDKRKKCLTSGEVAIKAVASAEAILKLAPKNGSGKVKW